MQQEKKLQVSPDSSSPIRVMEQFRSNVNSNYFGEPLASAESFIGYGLGIGIHVVLMLMTQTIWPIVVVACLLVSAIFVSQFMKRRSSWHILEFAVISLELALIALFFADAFVGVLFIGAVVMYRAGFTFGARLGALLSVPLMGAFVAVFMIDYLNGDAVISVETALAILCSYLLLIVTSFTDSIVIGSVLQRMAAGDAATMQMSGSLDAIFDSIGEGIIGVDRNLNVTFANKKALEMLDKRSITEVQGQPSEALRLFVDKEGKPMHATLNPFKLSLDSVATIHYRISTINKVFTKTHAGVVAPLGLTVSPIMAGSKPDGVVAVLKDITGDSIVDKGKSEFVALASHHLRTPINAVRWNLERLLKKDTENLTDKQRRIIDTIEQSNTRILTLVNNLLSVSRVETDTLHIAREEVDAAKLLTGAQEAMHDIKKKEGTKLQVTTDNSARVLTNSDKYVVRVVYENVLSNALHYAAGKTVKAHLSYIQPAAYAQVIGGQNVVAPSGGMLLTVEDDGIGIAPSDRKNIFQKMYRTDNARTAYADGTGLGLYLSRQLVGAVGGKIWFESELNKGSTFYVFLPIAPPVQQGDVSATGSR